MSGVGGGPGRWDPTRNPISAKAFVEDKNREAERRRAAADLRRRRRRAVLARLRSLAKRLFRR